VFGTKDCNGKLEIASNKYKHNFLFSTITFIKKTEITFEKSFPFSSYIPKDAEFNTRKNVLSDIN
jgi:hypothetical protein